MPDNSDNSRRPAGPGGAAPKTRMTPWILIALAVTALLAFNQFSSAARSNEISYTEFQTAVTDSKIDPDTVVKISDTSLAGAI